MAFDEYILVYFVHLCALFWEVLYFCPIVFKMYQNRTFLDGCSSSKKNWLALILPGGNIVREWHLVLFISKDVRGADIFWCFVRFSQHPSVSANTPPEKPIEDSRKHAWPIQCNQHAAWRKTNIKTRSNDIRVLFESHQHHTSNSSSSQITSRTFKNHTRLFPKPCLNHAKPHTRTTSVNTTRTIWSRTQIKTRTVLGTTLSKDGFLQTSPANNGKRSYKLSIKV